MPSVQILRQKHTRSSDGGFEQAGASARRKHNRTPMGSGTVQLVSPHLVNWIGLDCPFSDCTPRSETTAATAILRLQFVPEPSSWLMLGSGIGLLGVFYPRRR